LGFWSLPKITGKYYELVKSDSSIEKEKLLPLVYEEVKLDCGYRTDSVIVRRIVVEVNPWMFTLTFISRVLTYLGLNINRLVPFI